MHKNSVHFAYSLLSSVGTFRS